jgi:hypothetical protein
MARTTRTDTTVLVAIESFTVNDQAGNPIVVHRGSRWRSNDPIVKRKRDLFIEDGSTDGEIMRAREAAGITSY